MKEIEKENWAKHMFMLLKEGRKKNKEREITKKYINKFEKIYKKIIEEGVEFHKKLKPIPK